MIGQNDRYKAVHDDKLRGKRTDSWAIPSPMLSQFLSQTEEKSKADARAVRGRCVAPKRSRRQRRLIER